MNKKLIYLGLHTGIYISCMLQAAVVPYVGFRSQGINGAREMVGWQTDINRYDSDQNYCCLSITPEFTRSFDRKKIAQALFCDALVADTHTTFSSCASIKDNGYCSASSTCWCDCPLIKIQGSKAPGRNPKALMAENFYLPADFSSDVAFSPVINNIIVDFNLYCGFDEWLEGLYFRIHTPLCYTRWNLQMCEKIERPGTESYDVGYFDGTYQPADYTNPQVHGLQRSSMLPNFTAFVCAGNSIANLPNLTCDGLSYARMNTDTLTATRLAEITAALGYNFLLCEDYYLGFNIRTAAPTGNRPQARWLFEPIVGNGHHWELGAGIDSRWCIWRSEDEDRDVTCYLDGTITHLFKTKQIRSFDICCKPLSRYMLAMQFSSTVENLKISDQGQSDPFIAHAPSAQFASRYTPVANLTTAPCLVSAAVQGEVTFDIVYTWKNLQWETGYNFWGRSRLNICRTGAPCNTLAYTSWGLKGDAFIYGFPATHDPLVVGPQGVPLSATESRATIFEGTNMAYDSWNTNPGIDSPGRAFDSTNYELDTHVNHQQDLAHQAVWLPTQSSREPIFITEDSIDVNGAQTKGFSNQLFMHLSYTWQEIRDWEPFFGAGFQIEFGMQDQCCCSSNSPICCPSTSSKTIALSQWGIWLKGGCSFN